MIARILPVEAHSVPEAGIGTLKDDPVKIVLKENAQSYSVSTTRHVAIPLMPKVKAEVECMEREGVIRGDVKIPRGKTRQVANGRWQDSIQLQPPGVH